MDVIKRKKNEAYILIEGLVALATIVTICSLLLTAIDTGRQQQREAIRQQEILNLAQMAIQSKQSSLERNGVRVTINRSPHAIAVYHEGQEVLYVVKD